MLKTYPKIDNRSSSDIARQVQKLLKERYTPEWHGDFNSATGEPKGLSTAIISIFARLAEIIIHRLNKVPEKNFLAFLDLLGASLMPPQPSRAPLTFTLARGAVVDAVVPKGTRVAAPPDEGEKEPVIFETDRELVVTSAQLASVYFIDPSKDMYSDKSPVTESGGELGVRIFQADEKIEHILYLGSSPLLAYSHLNTLSLRFDLEKRETNGGLDLSWEFWNGSIWEEKIPAKDNTENLANSGAVVFENMNSVPPRSVNSLNNRWLRCRLKTPITPDVQCPVINALDITVEIEHKELDIDSGFTNSQPLDLSKEFYPFGERPRYGDVFYISSSNAFSQSGAEVKLHVELVNPSSGSPDTEIPPVSKKGNPKLRWEIWNGERWTELKVSDTTGSFTRTGDIKFTLGDKPAITEVNGADNYWIRVRLAGGNYGKEARYELTNANKPADGFTLIPATFAPPLINNAIIDYKLTKSEKPEAQLIYNNFVYEDITLLHAGGGGQFAPFTSVADEKPTLNLCFTLPEGRTDFPNRKISLYAAVLDRIYGKDDLTDFQEARPKVTWELWDGGKWSKVTVNDETGLFSKSGFIEFLAPDYFSTRTEFGSTGYWLRVSLEENSISSDPSVCKILLNTISATQTVTIKDEILGSSNASENQLFHTTRAPVLSGQRLHVREPDLPSSNVLSTSAKDGDEAVSIVSDETGRPKEIWIQWNEVPDFYGSSPYDRHYVLDHITGEIRFGDGQNGMSPPAGVGSIRMTEYKSGGGRRGNRPTGSIVELKTSIPYIDKVVNPAPAAGGADDEAMDSLLGRAPRKIRHRGRAVTIEDYEDLAIQASTEVARAMCIPIRNLLKYPFAEPVRHNEQGELGEVSVIIVPQTKDLKPRPSVELIRIVQCFLESNAIPTVNISVVGPLFVSVNVTAEIVLASMEGAGFVEQEIHKAIERFLHPLTGGSDSRGWNFGRKPHKSDFYGLIEPIPGVDHINNLTIEDIEDHPGVKNTGRFLVYSGNHDISLLFE